MSSSALKSYRVFVVAMVYWAVFNIFGGLVMHLDFNVSFTEHFTGQLALRVLQFTHFLVLFYDI